MILKNKKYKILFIFKKKYSSFLKIDQIFEIQDKEEIFKENQLHMVELKIYDNVENYKEYLLEVLEEVNENFKEKNINIEISKKLKKYLNLNIDTNIKLIKIKNQLNLYNYQNIILKSKFIYNKENLFIITSDLDSDLCSYYLFLINYLYIFEYYYKNRVYYYISLFFNFVMDKHLKGENFKVKLAKRSRGIRKKFISLKLKKLQFAMNFDE